jgi:TonB family protein
MRYIIIIHLLLCSSAIAFAQRDSVKAVNDILAFQKELNDSYANPKESPLDPADLEKFTEHPFFPINLSYRVNAKLRVTPGTSVLHLKTSTARLTNDRIYGYVEFSLRGKEFSMPVYQSTEKNKDPEYADHLFFPFSDLTNGVETYGGGRYIDLHIPKGDDIIVDFNKAYNPYCAYSSRYSCPKVPAENQMDIEIPVGVKYTKIEVKPNEVVAYFDKDWKKINTRDGASFYRTVEEKDKGFIVRDYYISGKIQMVAECSAFQPDPKFEGKRTLYFEDGTVQEEGFFEHNQQSGLYKTYYANGGHRLEIFYTADKEFYRHYWSESGEDLLHNGNGFVQEKSKYYSISVTEVKDSVRFGAFTVQGQDTVYSMVEKRAEYKGGMEKMFKDIRAALRYPASARRMGVQGKVFVEFVIGKGGRVSDFKVLKGISLDCDQAAVDATSTLNSWIPARHHNKVVASRFVLPITFKLER